jgi:hypothetical protein
VLALEPPFQAAVASGKLSPKDAYELFCVPAAHRAELYAAYEAGKSRAAVRKLAQALRSPR